MNILKASQTELLFALAPVASIVPNRSTLPILANIVLRKHGDAFEFVGSDIEIEVESRATLSGDAGDFTTTIAAAKIIGILKSFPADQVVSLSTDTAGKLNLKAGRSKFTLQTMDARDFPTFLEGTASDSFQISEKVLSGLIDQVHYAVADGDHRQFLNGMFLEAKAGTLTAVGTNGVRVAIAREKVEGVADQSAIIPRKAMLELRKMLGSSDEPVSVSISPNHARFEFKSIRFLTRLIAGKYPDYERVIPKNLEHKITGNRQALLSALRRSTLVLDDKVKAVRFQFTQGLLSILSASTAEYGLQEMDVGYDGPDITIGLPVAQVADGLSNFAHDVVHLHFTSKDKPLMMTYEDQPSYVYVVMPMRL